MAIKSTINKQLNPYIMYTITEVILPLLFIGLVAYFIGSVTRLFIHLLISEPCK